MIVEFSIENITSFLEKQTLSFEPIEEIKNYEDDFIFKYIDKKTGLEKKLLKLLGIGGKNNSGKTNLLSSLNIMRLMAIGQIQPQMKESKKEKEEIILPYVPFV